MFGRLSRRLVQNRGDAWRELFRRAAEDSGAKAAEHRGNCDQRSIADVLPGRFDAREHARCSAAEKH